jgi:hypothetical protein
MGNTTTMCMLCEKSFSAKNPVPANGSCEAHTIEDCAAQSMDDQGNHKCGTCENNKQPKSDGSGCEPVTNSIANCKWYERKEDGTVGCGLCNTGYYTDVASNTCKADSDFPGCMGVEGGKCMACNFMDGFYATDYTAEKGSKCEKSSSVYRYSTFLLILVGSFMLIFY